jgi:hypothetical protein
MNSSLLDVLRGAARTLKEAMHMDIAMWMQLHADKPPEVIGPPWVRANTARPSTAKLATMH